MIATISKQGGRRYPQMRSFPGVQLGPLACVGNAGVSTTLVGAWEDVITVKVRTSSVVITLKTAPVMDKI